MKLDNSIICIAGPTASGKSAFAVKIAKKIGGEIINADALQVYDKIQILSARPLTSEMEGIPHHMFGHISPNERYSTGKWLKEADALIMDMLARGKRPVLVGGTGLYFKALTQGMANIPPPPDSAVQAAQNILSDQGIDGLRREAARLDPPAFAKILGNDPQRLLRIVSVALGTEKPISEWQKVTKPVLPKAVWQGVALLTPREVLYERINARFKDMIMDGGLQEARDVFALGLDPSLPAMKAIGLSQLGAYMGGDMALDDAIDLAMRDTRRFAKRQFTWLRNQMPSWTKLETEPQKANFVRDCH